MILFKKTPTFDFMGKRRIFGGISLGAVVLCLVVVAWKGLNYGIDFAGGIEIQVQFKSDAGSSQVRTALESGNISDPNVVRMEGEQAEYLISVLGKSENAVQLADQVKTALAKTFGDGGFEIRRVDVVGSKVGGDLKKAGLYSILYTLVAILVYIWFRFDLKYAPGAVICLIHDAVITVGIFCLLGKEFNLTILAAILTILGYSLNDTIVVFDRIRETAAKGLSAGKLERVINTAINETLARTFLTAITTLITVGALYAKGGGIIHDFAFAMLVGVTVGTYSTVFIASPTILIMEKYVEKKAA